jgi:peptide/nickel transport system substrate-binding protein
MPPIRTLIAALAVGATLTACGSGSGTGAGAAGSGGSPKSGGTLTFAVSSDAGCIDPQQVASNDTIYTSRQIVDSLTDQDPQTGKIVPWLASSWQVNANATTFTFHLRKGATFSDGTPVDAAAVKANLDAIGKLGVNAVLASGYLTGYAGTTVVNDLTAQVRFKQPNAQFLQATSTFSLGLVSLGTTKKSAADRCKSVIGSGPFVLDSYVTNQSITLSKRTGYDWGSSLWKHKGAAYLDKIVYKIVPESGVRTGSLQSGQVDAIGSIGPQDEAALKSAGVQLLARANPGIVFSLGANNAHPIVKDPLVRKAISEAINRKEVVSTTFTKETKPATSILAATTPDYDNLSSLLNYNPQDAKKLLDSDGWKAGSNGIRQKNGKPLSLTVIWRNNAATNQPTLELIQQQLKAIGVQLKLSELSPAQITQATTSGDFDFSWGNLTRADPDILRNSFSSKLGNTYHISAGPLDKALEGQVAATDPGKRRQLVDQAQRLIVQNYYSIPVVELTTVLGVSTKVHNLNFEASSRVQLYDTWKS